MHFENLGDGRFWNREVPNSGASRFVLGNNLRLEVASTTVSTGLNHTRIRFGCWTLADRDPLDGCSGAGLLAMVRLYRSDDVE